MTKMQRFVYFGLIWLAFTTNILAQSNKKNSLTKDTIKFGWGYTFSNDLYHRYTNPTKINTSNPSAGSAILNLGAGPKLWLGNSKVAFSVEGQAVWGIFGFSSKENKGYGTLAFPLLAKFNFKGLTTFDREGKLGFSIGGGLQYSRTELYGLSDEFVLKGVKRTYAQTYIVQAGYGFGVTGFGVNGFVRYGFHPDNDAEILSIGLQWDFNSSMLKNISNPASQL